MKVSAVGFLFRNKVKEKNLSGKNYTCIIHKAAPNGNYCQKLISSPLINSNQTFFVSPETAEENVCKNLKAITAKEKNRKFIGATIKDGIKETEIHSLISDKIFAIRTKDEFGKNHFRLANKKNTQKLLSKNLNVSI